MKTFFFFNFALFSKNWCHIRSKKRDEDQWGSHTDLLLHLQIYFLLFLSFLKFSFDSLLYFMQLSDLH